MRALGRLLVLVILAGLAAPFAPVYAQVDDPEDLGFVDDDAWESPGFGIEVTWSRDWEPNLDTTTVEEDAEHLPLVGDGIYLDVYLIVDDETVTEYAERFIGLRAEDWERDDFALIALEGDDDEWAAFAYTFGFEDATWIGLVEITGENDELHGVQFVTPLDDLEDSFDTTMESVEIDGDTPFVHHWDARSLPDGDEDPIDLDDIVIDDGSDAIDDGTDGGESGEMATLWEGELHGADVACTDAWTTNDDNAFIDEENGVESVSIAGPNGQLILTFASAVDADLEFVLDVQRDVIADQWDWVDLEEIDTGSDDGAAWAGFSGEIGDVPQVMVVEAGWHDLDDESVAIVQFISNADTFEDGFGDVYSECTIDGSFPFTHYFPGNVDEVLEAA